MVTTAGIRTASSSIPAACNLNPRPLTSSLGIYHHSMPPDSHHSTFLVHQYQHPQLSSTLHPLRSSHWKTTPQPLHHHGSLHPSLHHRRCKDRVMDLAKEAARDLVSTVLADPTSSSLTGTSNPDPPDGQRLPIPSSLHVHLHQTKRGHAL